MIKIVDSINEANCITHSGTMHADEVFSTAFLELYLGDVKVFRTSNVDSTEVNDSVFVYDIGRGKFDHHQNDALKRENGIIYAAFGLLWKELGKDFLKKQEFDNVDEMFLAIDKDLIEAIDADDNGQFPKIEANYKVKTLSGVIKLFNPSYEAFQSESEQFLKAVNLAKTIIEEELLYINGKVIADKKVQEILDECDGSEKYLILDEYLPYEEVLLNHEKAANVLFVAFPSNRGGYAVKTLPKSVEDKTARLEFPEEWKGLTGTELEEVSGIKGLRFCHSARFIINCENIDTVYEVFAKICK
ncbi:MAG: MYG1 family protein [Bacilli bacterium]|nr:MYG1 family protein [Bacilli bacterium]